MDLLILGGNSQRNKEWVYKVNSFVGDLFEDTLVHEYRHWQNGEEMIDFDAELKITADEAQALSDYGVFAKSVGSLLTITLIDSNELKPVFCVFAGVALKLAKESDIDIEHLVKSLKCPVVIIQNDKDPVGTFAEVSAIASGLDNVQVVETVGDDHSYDDLELIRSELERNLV